MRHRSLLILTTVLTTGALTLTACGSRDDSNKSSSGDTQTVVIGVDAPITGDLSALGLGIKNSAELAVKTANKEKTVPGITFEVKPLDDQAQPSVGQQNAQKFIDDDTVLGVVGPLNSGVSQSMQKPLNDASLTQVSPPTRAPNSPRARTGRPATRSAPTRPTSAPPPRTRSRAPSQRSTSSTTRRSSRSTSSTTRSPTAPVSPPPSRTPSPPSAARSSAPTTSTPTTATSTPSSPRSRSPAPRPSTTAASTSPSAP